MGDGFGSSFFSVSAGLLGDLPLVVVAGVMVSPEPDVAVLPLVGAGVGAGLLHSTHGSGVSVLMCLTSTGLYLFLDYKET